MLELLPAPIGSVGGLNHALNCGFGLGITRGLAPSLTARPLPLPFPLFLGFGGSDSLLPCPLPPVVTSSNSWMVAVPIWVVKVSTGGAVSAPTIQVEVLFLFVISLMGSTNQENCACIILEIDSPVRSCGMPMIWYLSSERTPIAALNGRCLSESMAILAAAMPV